MSRRIGVDAGVACSPGEPPRAPCEDLRLGRVDVVDHDVEVELLRPCGVGPVGWLVARGQLEREA